jgi:hypothetical protein
VLLLFLSLPPPLIDAFSKSLSSGNMAEKCLDRLLGTQLLQLGAISITDSVDIVVVG